MTKRPQPKCPICEKPVGLRPENQSFPFCSVRCKQQDLGKWLGGDYSVAGRPASPHEIADELRRGGGDN